MDPREGLGCFAGEDGPYSLLAQPRRGPQAGKSGDPRSQNADTFKGVIPGVEALCMGSITLEVVFGSPDNFRSEDLIFDIVPFRSGYRALLGQTAFA